VLARSERASERPLSLSFLLGRTLVDVVVGGKRSGGAGATTSSIIASSQPSRRGGTAAAAAAASQHHSRLARVMGGALRSADDGDQNGGERLRRFVDPPAVVE